MKNYIVTVVSPGNAELCECEVPQLSGDLVLIRNHYTVVSAGTERANLLGMPNTSGQFPYYPGYCGAGEVVAVGPEASLYKPGDRVVVNWGGHRLYTVKSECALHWQNYGISQPDEATVNLRKSALVRIPEPVSMLDAAFANIASFAFNGVRKLRLEIGDSAMIAGQGVLGIFALQVAALSGAVPLIASDFSPERRELAIRLGADYALDPGDADYLEQIREITGGEGVRGIVEVTGSAAALQQALEYVAWEGRISLLGCTRISDAPIDFYKSIHRRGIQLIGAHTHSRAVLESSPYHWTQEDDYRAFLKLLANGKMKASPIISQIVSPKQCHEVYQTIGTRKNPPLGIVFDWTQLQ